MEKRGQLQAMVEWFIHLFLILIVIAVFLSASAIIKDNKLHKLRVEARDYAFTWDSILSSSDKIIYNYEQNKNISITFDNERCLVQTKHKTENTQPINFFCGLDKTRTPEQEQLGEIRRIKNE